MDQLAYRHLVNVAYTEDEMKAIAAEVMMHYSFMLSFLQNISPILIG